MIKVIPAFSKSSTVSIRVWLLQLAALHLIGTHVVYLSMKVWFLQWSGISPVACAAAYYFLVRTNTHNIKPVCGLARNEPKKDTPMQEWRMHVGCAKSS